MLNKFVITAPAPAVCTCVLAGVQNEPGMLLGVAVVRDPEDGPAPLAKPTSKACIKRVKFIVNNLRRYLRKLKVRSLYSGSNLTLLCFVQYSKYI